MNQQLVPMKLENQSFLQFYELKLGPNLNPKKLLKDLMLSNGTWVRRTYPHNGYAFCAMLSQNTVHPHPREPWCFRSLPSCGCSQKKEKKRKTGKLVPKERKENGKEKEKKSPQGPEARKPRSSWRKALEPLTIRIRISRYPDNLAVTYAERKISHKLSKESLCCCDEVGVLAIFQINSWNQNPLKRKKTLKPPKK